MKTHVKQRIIDQIKTSRAVFDGTDSEFAVKIGMSAALYSRVKSGEEDLMSERMLLGVADKLYIDIADNEWKIAETRVYKDVVKQLAHCKEHSVSGMLCDLPDIGKTVAAKDFARKNSNVVYIDCGLYKTKQQLIRKIAQDFGAYNKGRYHDILIGLVSYVKKMHKPLIILDEAGDLDQNAFLELKALWNAFDGFCGWYRIGANGLRRKMERGIANETIGYEETYSRFGARIQRLTPEVEKERIKLIQQASIQIIKLNAGTNADVNKILAQAQGSLRRIRIELSK